MVGAENVGLVTSSVNRQWRRLLPETSFWATVDFPRYSRKRASHFAYFTLLQRLLFLTFNLRRRRFDIAVDLRTQLGYNEGKLVCLLSGARHRVGGPGARSASLFLTAVDPTSTGHESERLRARLEKALGTPLTACHVPLLRVSEPAKRRGRRVVIHPGAGHPSKQWPETHWRSLLTQLSAQLPPCEVIVAAASSEAKLAEDVCSGTNATVRLTATIPDLVELITSASLVIGLDSAAVHVAALCGTRTLTIFAGTTDPARWQALGESKILVQPVPCSPCWSGECKVLGHPCMSRITPERVLRDALGILNDFAQ